MNTISNPYIGPRTFKEDERDRFYGRDREANELLARVLSEQEIVFYAQSGAGKSSLVNTCLIPDLNKKGFEILRGRVGGEAPADLPVHNIFVFNLVRSLSTSDSNVKDLASRSLNEFLMPATDASSDSEGRSAKRRALIIDQFEEIFSTHHEAWEKRKEFFEQLAGALEADPRLRVIFVMREDYIAALDPYADILPNQFRMRYYMQRLEKTAALKAVTEPVKGKDFSRPYEAGAAEKLVDDLRTIKVINPDGTPDIGVGQFVEPLYLQVICYELWNNLPRDGTTITRKNVDDIGDVSTSLGNYYARRVAAIAEAEDVSEGKIRKWFTEELISPAGIRNMVLQEPGETSANLENKAIRALSDLVRAEQRGGAIFYELTHDRLVGPIIASNQKWFDEHLSPLQKQAALWDAQGRMDSWLLSDQALAEVEQWAEANPDEVAALENEFLETCRARQNESQAQQKREADRKELEAAKNLMDEQTRSARIARRFTIVAVILAVIAIFSSINAFSKAEEAEVQKNVAVTAQAEAEAEKAIAQEQANAALSGQLSAFALNKLSSQPDLAILLSLQADKLKSDINSRNALLIMQQENAAVQSFLGLEALPDEFQFSPDGKIMVSRDQDGIALWDTNTLEKLNDTPFNDHFSGVTAWAVSQDGRYMASGGADGTIIIWDVIEREKISGPFKSHKGRISRLAFNKENTKLASASWDVSGIILWDITDPADPQPSDEPLLGHDGSVASLAFSPDGKTLASGGNSDNTIILWDVESQRAIGEPLTGHSGIVISMAFTPDGKILASGSYDYTNILWDVRDLEKPEPMGEPLKDEIYIDVVAISPDGKTLASGNDNGDILLWDISTPKKSALISTLYSDVSWVISLAFSQDGKTLASGSLDGKVILWDVINQTKIGETLSAHKASVSGVALQPGSETLITASEDSFITFWTMADTNSLKQDGDSLQGHLGSPIGIRFSADGSLLASLGYEGTIFFDLASQEKLGYGDFLETSANDDILAYQITKNGELTLYIKEITSGDVTTIPIQGTDPILAPDAKTLVYQTLGTESAPSLLHLWDVSAHKELSDPVSGELPIFSPDGQVLIYYTRDADGQDLINIWDLAKLESVGEPIPGVFQGISPDNKRLFYTTFEPEMGTSLIYQWDIAEASQLGESIRVNNFWVSANGETLAFEYFDEATGDSFVKALNMVTGELSENLGEDVEFISLSSDGQFLLCKTYTDQGDSSVNVVDTRSSETVIGSPITGELASDANGSFRIFQAGPVLAFEVNNKGHTQLVLIDTPTNTLVGNVIDNGIYLGQASDGQILVYQVENEINLLDTTTQATTGQAIKGTYLGISPDSKTVASHNGSSLITFWDLEKSWPLGAPVQNATEEASSAVLSQDGSTLAWIGEDGIVVHDAISGETRGGPFIDNSTNIIPGSLPVFSKDGKLLVSGNFSTQSTTLWDLESGQQVGDELPGSYAAFSPNSNLLAIGNYNSETTTLWDVKSSEQVGAELPNFFVFPAFSPDGKFLAAGNFNSQTTIVWDVNTQEQAGDELPGIFSAFSPDGKFLAIGNPTTQTTTLRDLITYKQVGDELPGVFPAFNLDGTLLAIGSFDSQTTTVWDVNTREQVGDELPGGLPAFSPGGNVLAVGNDSLSTTTVWDLNTRKQMSDELSGVWPAFGPDGRVLAVGDEYTYTTMIWGLNAENSFSQPITSLKTPPENLTLSSDGKYLASFASGGFVIRNLDADTALHLELGDYAGQFNGLMSFYADDTRFAAVGDDGTLLTWDAARGELTIPDETDQPPQLKAATASTFSPTGDYLAYVYDEATTLIIWDVKNGSLYSKLKDPEIEKPVGALSFSADGKWLAYNDGPEIVVWDMQNKKAVTGEPLLTEAISINQLNLIMDGAEINYIVSMDETNTAQIWDWKSRTKIGNPMQDLRIVGINAQDRLAYYLDPKGRLIRWQWGSDLTSLLCPLVKRNFTLDEWKTYFGERDYPSQKDLTCPEYPAGQ